MSPAPLLKDVQVEPSILSADFGRFREQVQEVLDAGARVIHVDVMDGHFVPQLTVGPKVVAALADTVAGAGGLLDVHMMVERPERHVRDFVKAGAGSVTIHAEATPHLAYAANLIRESGAGVGVAINPATPPSVLSEIADVVDLVLCMTVNPGWGGQAFIERSTGKLERLRELVGAELPLQVDGGVDADTAPRCRVAGANLFVAGSAIFDWKDPAAAYQAIVASLG
jgi:ribulose-phosphate 3-epimerase